MPTEKLTVGQELWWVPSDMRGSGDSLKFNDGRAARVTKVGRIWASLSNLERINVETMLGDGRGYTSSGEAFLSRNAAEAEIKRRAAWEDLKKLFRFNYKVPPRPTLEQIQAFHDLIKEKPDAE